MTQRSIFEDDEELPVRRSARAPASWPERWQLLVDNPPPGACGGCGGTGWSALLSDGGRICAKCGGSGRDHNKTRRVSFV